MGVSWGSSSQRRWLTPAARRVTGFRQPVTPDRSVLLASQRPRGPVTFSEWRGVLDALAQLHRSRPGSGFLLVGGPVETPGRVHVGTAVNDAPPSLPPFAAVPLDRNDWRRTR
jgi:hypothetical protein